MRTITAAVLTTPTEAMEMAKIQIADPRTGEVLVRVHYCGLCHSDLSFIDGHMPSPGPVVLGHETAGVVEAVGPGVTAVSTGDKVVLTPLGGRVDG
jgi:aryl-alcohol dehydrogenase